MAEIQRHKMYVSYPASPDYETCVAARTDPEGPWQLVAESEAWHLADKTAALEAKDNAWAESFRQEKGRNRLALEAQAESVTRRLNAKHAAELAALRGEGEPLTFRDELTSLINRHSMENGSDTPDFILAEFLEASLGAWDWANCRRARWYRAKEADDA